VLPTLIEPPPFIVEPAPVRYTSTFAQDRLQSKGRWWQDFRHSKTVSVPGPELPTVRPSVCVQVNQNQ